MKRGLLRILIVLGLGSLSCQAQELNAPVSKELHLQLEDTVELVKTPKFYIPKKAAMLSAVFPGLGQIYNGKWWKTPFVYAAVAGTVYGISWNNKYYSLYKNGYYDWIDNDPNSTRYLEVLPPGSDLESIDGTWFKSQLLAKKDGYRRDRDFMIILAAGVYLLNIIDANVDAHLSDFDVSPDLSMQLAPTILENRGAATFGLACTFKF